MKCVCYIHTILKFEAFSKALCNNFLLKIGIFDVWDIRKVFLFFERGGSAPAPPNITVNSDISDSTGHNNVKFSSQENLLLLLIFQFVKIPEKIPFHRNITHLLPCYELR